MSRGTVLFRLDGRVAEVALEKAKKALAFAEDNFERQKKLLPVEGTSKKSYLEAEQQLNAARSDAAGRRDRPGPAQMTAPLDGTVVKINSEPGEAVELNTVLAVIVDLDRLVASVDVPSAEAAGLKTRPARPLRKKRRRGRRHLCRQPRSTRKPIPCRFGFPFRPGPASARGSS